MAFRCNFRDCEREARPRATHCAKHWSAGGRLRKKGEKSRPACPGCVSKGWAGGRVCVVCNGSGRVSK